MRLGILTSVETRHCYFAQALREHLPVAAVCYEQTGYTPATILPPDLTPEEVHIVNDHFAERARQEKSFFGAGMAEGATKPRSHEATKKTSPPSLRRFVASSLPLQSSIGNHEIHIQSGALNSPATLQFLESANVDTLVVYGTNLIKEPLLSRFAGRIINMHLGLSPYYRGTATNFYPLLNEEPEYVGATIHLIDAGIDSGPIFKHARPEIDAADRPHTIGCKAIQAGIDAMIAVLRDFAAGRARPVPQWRIPNARLYLRKDYHPRQVVELYRKLEAGLIPKYLKRVGRTSPTVCLIEL